jgi:hypothetical protein
MDHPLPPPPPILHHIKAFPYSNINDTTKGTFSRIKIFNENPEWKGIMNYI